VVAKFVKMNNRNMIFKLAARAREFKKILLSTYLDLCKNNVNLF